jgi:hypothetical protein
MKSLTAVLALAAAFAVTPASSVAQTPSAAELDADLARILAEKPAYAPWLAANRDIVLAGPKLPGAPWRVHDIRRPQPPRLDTGRKPCGRKAPADAIVLFDGRSMDKWTGPHVTDWSMRGGAMVAAGRQFQLIQSTAVFGDQQVHLEFRTPDNAADAVEPQQRGNSGVYLQGRYEIQVLNSHSSDTYPDGTVGAIYGQTPPLVNAARPPNVWQCYDITFRAPRFDGAYLTEPARITAYLNGVLVQHDTVIQGSTVWRQIAQYEPHGPGPLGLQDHGDPTGRVAYRNIWVRPLDLDARR